MKSFRSLAYLFSVGMALLFITSTSLMAGNAPSTSTPTAAVAKAAAKTASKPAAAAKPTGVPRSVLESPQGPPTPGLTPQYGGTLKIIANRTIANLGAPWKANSAADTSYSRFAVEGLTGVNAKGQKIPQLATKWVYDAGKKTITFTLRKGVKFHDGTDFNAEAVKWNLDMYRKGTKTDLKDVTSIDVLDDYNVRLTFSSWDPFFVSGLSSNVLKMVSPTAAKKLIDAGKEADVTRTPVGTGPFKLASFTPNVSLKYVRNENYWQKGLPYLDAVDISLVADPVVALASYTRGEAQVLNPVSTIDVKALKEKGDTIVSYVTSIVAIGGDSKNHGSPFADIRVRRAIAYAINGSKLANSVYEGYYAPTNQLSIKGKSAYDPSIKGYPYNPAKAKELLAQAGYTVDKPLTLKCTYNTDPQATDLITAIQGELKKVGVNLTLEPLDDAAFTKLRASAWNNQLVLMNWPYNEIELQYSTSLKMGLSADQYMWVSIWTADNYNALYKKMMAEGDLKKRNDYYKKLNKMAVDDYCLMVPLYGSTPTTAMSPKVHDCGVGSVTASEFLPEIIWMGK